MFGAWKARLLEVEGPAAHPARLPTLWTLFGSLHIYGKDRAACRPGVASQHCPPFLPEKVIAECIRSGQTADLTKKKM